MVHFCVVFPAYIDTFDAGLLSSCMWLNTEPIVATSVVVLSLLTVVSCFDCQSARHLLVTE